MPSATPPAPLVVSQLDTSDLAQVHGFARVLDASLSHGRPHHEAPTFDHLLKAVTRQAPGEARHDFVATDTAGSVVGLATLFLSLDDNTDKAWLDVRVHPAARGRGAGSMLLSRALEEAGEAGRTEALVESVVPIEAGRDQAPGAGLAAAGHAGVDLPVHPHLAFAQQHGFEVASTEMVRELPLPVDPSLLERLTGQAEEHRGQAYRIESMTSIRDELLPSLLELHNRLDVDAPSGSIDFEEETLTPEKWRDDERWARNIGRIRLSSLAIHEPTGRVVAYNDLALLPGQRRAMQWGTFVDAEHRGHRLGLAVKLAGILALQRDHPERSRIETCNNETNRWMIAINEALGFRPIERILLLRRQIPG